MNSRPERPLLEGIVEEMRQPSPVQWGVHLLPSCGSAPESECPNLSLKTASVGKVLLLLTVANLIEHGALNGNEVLSRLKEDAADNSGLWRHLDHESLTINDLAVLVGSVSDNLATNVLLRRIGLAAVKQTTTSLGFSHTLLADRVRDRRTASDPVSLSWGSARELCSLFDQMRLSYLKGDGRAFARVAEWLALGCDLSMVAGSFMLDPLAHQDRECGILLVNKTGTDAGVRVDAGFVVGPSRSVSYCAIANWDKKINRRDLVMKQMRQLGDQLRAWVMTPA